LSQIAVELKEAGIVDAKEGKGGGYYLKKSLDKISLKDMVEAVDGKIGLVDCQVGEYCGNQGFCKNKGKWNQIRDEIARVLDNYTIGDIFGDIL